MMDGRELGLEAKKEEEEIIAALEDRDNAYQLQTECVSFLFFTAVYGCTGQYHTI